MAKTSARIAIERLRPNVGIGASVNQLGIDANVLAFALHCPFHDMATPRAAATRADSVSRRWCIASRKCG